MHVKMGVAVNFAYLLLFLIIALCIISVLRLLFKRETDITEFAVSVPLTNLLKSHIPIKTIRVRNLNTDELIDVLSWNGEELLSLSGSDFDNLSIKKCSISDAGRLTVWSERS